MIKTKTILAVAAIGFLTAMTPAHAILIGESEGGRAAWETLVSSPTDVPETWAVDTNPWDLNYIYGAGLAPGNAIGLPSGTTISFSELLYGLQVPDTWGTWPGVTAPDVLKVLHSEAQSVTATFSSPVSFFGLEMEPNTLAVFSMTLNNGDILTQLVNGDSGAAFFGWVGDSVVSFTMTAEDPAGFAFGRMVEGSAPPPVNGVPDGGSLGLVSALVFAGMLGFAKRERRA